MDHVNHYSRIMSRFLLAKFIFSFVGLATVFCEEPTSKKLFLKEQEVALFGQSERGSRECINETTLRVRYNSDEIVVNCPNDRPYCDKQLILCVETRPLPQFKCPDINGIYPLINDCSGYIVCQNNITYKFTCGEKEKYDHLKQSCSRRGKCPAFNCKKKSGRFVPHATDERLYALCEAQQPISLEQCAVGWRFNERNQVCEIQCAGDGTIRDPSDDGKYFVCKQGRKGYDAMFFTCPWGMSYNSETNRCEPTGNQAPVPPAPTTPR